MASNAIENLDPKTDQKLRSVNNTIDKLKDCKKFIKDYISAAQKMHSAAQAFAAANKSFADALQRLASQHNDDIGSALTSLAGRQMATSEALEAVARSLQTDLATPLESGIENGARELETFASDTKDSRTRLAAELKKLESATKKVAKQGDAALINSMKEFNAKRDEIDRFKSDRLHTVFLIERRRFGEILGATLKVSNSQIEYARTIMQLEGDVATHQPLMGTLESLSDEQVASLQVFAEKAYQSLNTGEGANVTLTEATNRAAFNRPQAGGSTPRGPPPSGPPASGPPSSMPPPPNFSPGPPSSMPPPPNFSPGPPSSMPPPPAFSPPPMGGDDAPRGLPKMPPKMPSGGPPSPMGRPPPSGPPPSNGTMGRGSKAPPPMPSGSPRGPPSPMGGPPPAPAAPPPPPAGGGPPPPPGGGPPPPPKAAPKSSSKPSKAGKSGGGTKLGGGDPSSGRGGLLDSISGFKGGLKKTVTNDRSGPILKEDKKPGPGGRGVPPMF